MGFGAHNEESWRIGIVDALRARRDAYKRYAYQAPVIVAPLPLKAKAEPPVARRVFPFKSAAVRAVIRAVSAAWDVEPGELLSRRRPQRLALPRFAIYRLLTERSRWSINKTSKVLKRDHTSVLHGLKRASELLRHNDAWRERYHAALAELKRGTP